MNHRMCIIVAVAIVCTVLRPSAARGQVQLPGTERDLPDWRTGIAGLGEELFPAFQQKTVRAVPVPNPMGIPIHLIDTMTIINHIDTLCNTYTFDETGKKTLQLTSHRWENAWENYLRHTFRYNAQGKILSDVKESWANGRWEGRERIELVYNDGGSILSRLEEYWAGDRWVGASRQTNTYDSTGRLQTQLREIGTASDSQWINDRRETISYDANGDCLLYLYESWAKGRWTPGFRNLHVYNTEGKKVRVLLQDWSDGLWQDEVRSTYGYDSIGFLSTLLSEEWFNGRWKKAWRWTIHYTAGGHPYEYLEEHWVGDRWANNYRFAIAYDAYGNRIADTAQSWGSRWVDEYHGAYRYDAWANPISAVFEHRGWFSWGPYSREGVIVDSAGNSYPYLGSEYTITWRQMTTGAVAEQEIPPQYFTLFQNYPNPFNPSTEIIYRMPEAGWVLLKIYNLLGQEVATLVNEVKEPGEHRVRWEAGNNPSGVYVYRLSAGKNVLEKKMLVIK